MVHVSTPHESKQCGKFSDTFVSSFKSPSMGKHKRPVKRITSKKPLFELLDVGDDACHVKYLNSARPKKHVQRSRQAETESPDRFIYFGEASTPSAQTSNPQETQNVSRDLLALVGPTTRPPEAPRAAASASIASKMSDRKQTIREEDVVEGLDEIGNENLHHTADTCDFSSGSLPSSPILHQDAPSYNYTAPPEREKKSQPRDLPKPLFTPVAQISRPQKDYSILDDEDDANDDSAELRWLKLI
jgi:hypothetical protein